MGVDMRTDNETQVQTIRLGAGAGFAGDRIDPAVELAEHADLDYLIFECLGERTVAAGQLRRRQDRDTGYDPLLLARIDAVIDHTLAAGTTVITNAGSANPLAAADAVATMLRQRGVARPVRIAAVTGDDVGATIRVVDPDVWETGKPSRGTPRSCSLPTLTSVRTPSSLPWNRTLTSSSLAESPIRLCISRR